jgi:PRTRC genetic system protein E
VFVELVPLLKDRTLLITVAGIEGKLKVNLIPAKVKEGEEQALTTPLSFTGSAEELDAELGNHLTAYVQSHLELRNLQTRVRFPVALPTTFCYLVLLLVLPRASSAEDKTQVSLGGAQWRSVGGTIWGTVHQESVLAPFRSHGWLAVHGP